MCLISLNAFSFQSLEEGAFPDKKFSNRKGPRTNAVLVWKEGQIIYERYERNYNKNKKHILWSISKSISSLLFAVAESKDLVRRTDSICKYIQLDDLKKCDIQFDHLLTWSSGLNWAEKYKGKVTESSVLRMLYGPGYFDVMNFVLDHDWATKPGSSWRYSSGDTNVMTALLPKIFKEKQIHPTFQKNLFDELGVKDWVLETGANGEGFGSSYFYMKPYDLLKIGILVLNKGEWAGKNIYDKSWHNYLVSAPESYKKKRFDHDGDLDIGGASFWLNDHRKAGTKEPPWKGAPADTIMAMGHWGQFLMIVPSLKLVAIRFGDTRDNSYRPRDFAEQVVNGVVK